MLEVKCGRGVLCGSTTESTLKRIISTSFPHRFGAFFFDKDCSVILKTLSYRMLGNLDRKISYQSSRFSVPPLHTVCNAVRTKTYSQPSQNWFVCLPEASRTFSFNPGIPKLAQICFLNPNMSRLYDIWQPRFRSGNPQM